MKGQNVSLPRDVHFKQIQDALDVTMKNASSAGLEQASTIKGEAIENMWQEGIFGSSQPTQLLDTHVSTGLLFWIMCN